MSGEWYDIGTDGTFLNGILYPGDDGALWNQTPGKAIEDLVNGGLPDDNTLSQSWYDFKYKAFPNDLGMEYAGHYMIININVPITVTSARTPGSVPEAATNLGNNFTLLPNELSKVDVLRFSKGVAVDGATNSDSITSRRTRRIVESIALYMPGTQLVYNGMQTYEEISMTALAGQMAVGVVSTAATIGSYFGGPAGALLSSAVGQTAGGIADQVVGGISTAAKLAGRPINPRVEVLFSLTPLRDFQFEFLMLPRNAEEAKTIREIVRTLRFHSSPELDNLGLNFIPPAEFDITFYYNGVESDKIPRINTCVMTRCEVDYAPGTGTFSTYHDGTPVAVRMMLVFREIEPVHKLRVLQGF